MKKESQTIFEPTVAEFVTVAAEYCAFVERAEGISTKTFVDKSLKLLPLLYLKASLLPEVTPITDEDLEEYVTEDIYTILRINIAGVMERFDDYLEVFKEEMVYSDTPIKSNVSEDMADIYQDLQNFLFVFRLGINETMNDSLVIVKESFAQYWGQKIVNSLRALHDIYYHAMPKAEDEDGDFGGESTFRDDEYEDDEPYTFED